MFSYLRDAKDAIDRERLVGQMHSQEPDGDRSEQTLKLRLTGRRHFRQTDKSAGSYKNLTKVWGIIYAWSDAGGSVRTTLFCW